MSIQLCLAKIKAYLKESGLDKNIPQYRIEYFAKRLDAISADSLTPAEFASKAQDLIEEQMVRESAQRRASAAQSLYRREANLKDLQANVQNWSDNPKSFLGLGKDVNDMPYEAFRVLQQGGSLRPGQGTNMSTPIMADSIRKDLLGLVNHNLDSIKGLKEAAQAGALDKDALIELASIDKGTPGMTTENTMAREYAKVLKVVRDRIFQMKQAINPFLEGAEEYLWKQMHDRERITAMGKEAWTQLIMTHAGQDSFPELSPPEKAAQFGKIYDKIEQGKWGSDAYEGEQSGKNIAKGQAASRQIQFNSAQSFSEYNSLAGPKTLFDGLMRITRTASNDIALMEKWGPNPELGREQTLSRFEKTLTPDQADAFSRKRAVLDKEWNVVQGAQNAPAYSTAAKALQGAMSMQYIVHGGFSSFRSPQDLAMGASLLHSLDQSSIFARGAEITTNFIKAFTSSNARNAQLENYGLFTQTMQRELVRDLGSPTSSPGTLSKMAQSMGILNMHSRIVDSISASVGHVLTKMLGDISDTKFSDLPDSWKQGLSRYGFDENKWNIARLGTETIDGKVHMTPEGIQKIPNEAVENYLRKSGQFKGENSPSDRLLDRGRDQLQMALGSMVNEHAALSSARTDVRQRDFLWGDTNINEGAGMLRRMVSEFKSASLVQSDLARRAYFSGTSPKGDLVAVAKLLAMNALLFGMGDAAKSALQGKTPEDPTSLNYIGKAVFGSGASGIYLDTLVNAMNEDSITDKSLSMAKSMVGPVASTGIDAASAALQVASGKKGGAMAATKWGLGNLVPYQNLPYTKALFDYYIADSLKELTSPGYRGRIERRAAQKGQSYIFGRPTSQDFLENR